MLLFLAWAKGYHSKLLYGQLVINIDSRFNPHSFMLVKEYTTLHVLAPTHKNIRNYTTYFLLNISSSVRLLESVCTSRDRVATR